MYYVLVNGLGFKEQQITFHEIYVKLKCHFFAKKPP